MQNIGTFVCRRSLMFVALVSTAVAIAPAQHTEVILHNFAGPPPYGANPYAGLASDAAGNLYGTTPTGGAFNQGTVFKVDPSGNMIVLHSFAAGADGANPYATVALDSAGNIYGTTGRGGTASQGTVYKIDASGNETVLYSFNLGFGYQALPGSVAVDPAGNLYGITLYPGSGTAYKLDKSGHMQVLHTFTGGTAGSTDGATPNAIAVDSHGNLYGTTQSGGTANKGTVFKIDRAGNEAILHSFTGGKRGIQPRGSIMLGPGGEVYGAASVLYKVDASGHETVLYAFSSCAVACDPNGLARDSAGNFYGTTFFGGASNTGTVYKVDPSGNLTVLYSFPAAIGAEGNAPQPSSVILDSAGNVCGTTRYGGSANMGTVFQLSPSGQETTFNFIGNADGFYPVSALTRDSRGNLYGTTMYGGATGLGTVFKLTPTGEETVLHTFEPGLGNGANPQTAVVLDSAGNVYGTTYFGGTSFGGILYKVDTSGNFTLLHDFTGPDCSYPGAVTMDAAGNLYGTTNSFDGCVYKVDPSGNFTVLHTFRSRPNGVDLIGGLTLDAAGNLYGTTNTGGETGTIYKLDPSGHVTVLHTFYSDVEIEIPTSGVVLDKAGNLYGTTFAYVYKLDPSGNYTVLYTFDGVRYDGGAPLSGVIVDSAGNLYGTTSAGGYSHQGIAFKLTPTGTLKVLHGFAGGTDGSVPLGGLIPGPGRTLYGTTSGGSETGGGVIFELERQ
jgi:uncharacterized repeat protein (TIGR03803 family)